MSDYADFMVRLAKVLERDDRYKEDAYLLVMAALGRAIENLESPRHVTGQELLGWLGREAEEQFGPMAQTVLDHWGVKNSLDFGHIVFNMVQEGILSKTESDCIQDFDSEEFFGNLFDHQRAYRLAEPSLPAKRATRIAKNGVKKNG